MENKEPHRLRRLFLRGILITLGCLGVLMIGALIIGKSLFKNVQVNTDYVEYTPKSDRRKELNIPAGEISDKNIMIFGVDKEETRTDTILLVHFNSKDKKVCIASVPRDTKVIWTEEQKEKAKELERPYQYESKITDMSSLGGIENLRYFTIRSVEEMLDVKVDNYVVVNTQVIRQLVDKLGGIEVNVPRVMQYDDNYQDLHIDLQPGLQVLNGEQAEGLLRWRHNNNYSEQYALGDLGRIETQQLFIEAFADKVLNDLSIGKIVDIITAVYSNVKTDMSFEEALAYTNYLPLLSMENIKLETLPGESKREDVWYYIIDEEKIQDFVDEKFYGLPPSMVEHNHKADQLIEDDKDNNSNNSISGESTNNRNYSTDTGTAYKNNDNITDSNNSTTENNTTENDTMAGSSMDNSINNNTSTTTDSNLSVSNE